MRRTFLAAAVAGFCVATSGAQTKLSGTAQCGNKPDVQHAVPVGDHAEHNLMVEQIKCSWSKPMEIGGDKSKEGVSTATGDSTGNTFRTRGFHVTTMESGDKIFLWYQGTGTTKDGVLQTQKGDWGFTGGSGKMKGLKGK